MVVHTKPKNFFVTSYSLVGDLFKPAYERATSVLVCVYFCHTISQTGKLLASNFKNKLNQFEQACADQANEKTPAKSAEIPKEQKNNLRKQLVSDIPVEAFEATKNAVDDADTNHGAHDADVDEDGDDADDDMDQGHDIEDDDIHNANGADDDDGTHEANEGGDNVVDQDDVAVVDEDHVSEDNNADDDVSHEANDDEDVDNDPNVQNTEENVKNKLN
ncbi:putative surface protein SACOL0050 [Stegodyphus dumicola]|uniref:putative surface protein SACOL0050 n=1 Tax=Stegodyphus dumicola TaxID=202533 RepID=UPI0015AEA0FB|nr:putative surface protein SACOL0050 [Stegodyphus dumicola]